MRQKQHLTNEQKQFIRDNFYNLTYQEIADHFDFESIYRVQKFCNENGLTKTKKVLNDEQKVFIRNFFLTMREEDMAKAFDVSRFVIQKFKRENGLIKQPWNVAKHEKKQPESIFFNVDARKCWYS